MAIKLLGIAGSLRKDSFNVAVLKTVAADMPEGVTLDVFPLNDVPMYNQDLDTATPPDGAAALRAAIGAADGVIISTPEYNYGMPGLLKNALDWASRPYGKATLTGKPVLTLSASPAFTGGARAQAQLNEALIAIAARIVLRPQTVIGAVAGKVQEGKLTDEATIGFIKQGIADLVRDIGVFGTVTKQES